MAACCLQRSYDPSFFRCLELRTRTSSGGKFVIVLAQRFLTSCQHLGQDLLQRVQVLNSVHAEEARAQVLSGTTRSQVSHLFGLGIDLLCVSHIASQAPGQSTWP